MKPRRDGGRAGDGQAPGRLPVPGHRLPARLGNAAAMRAPGHACGHAFAVTRSRSLAVRRRSAMHRSQHAVLGLGARRRERGGGQQPDGLAHLDDIAPAGVALQQVPAHAQPAGRPAGCAPGSRSPVRSCRCRSACRTLSRQAARAGWTAATRTHTCFGHLSRRHVTPGRGAGHPGEVLPVHRKRQRRKGEDACAGANSTTRPSWRGSAPGSAAPIGQLIRRFHGVAGRPSPIPSSAAAPRPRRWCRTPGWRCSPGSAGSRGG